MAERTREKRRKKEVKILVKFIAGACICIWDNYYIP